MLLSQKGLDSPLYHLKLTRHKICAKNLGWTRCTCKKVIQKQVIEKYRVSALVKKMEFTLCIFNSHASSNFYKKGHMNGWASCAHKKIDSSHLCLTLTLHAILTNKEKKTDHRGEWAPCAHKKCCVHLIYVCLSHVMQYSKKNTRHRGMWACCL